MPLKLITAGGGSVILDANSTASTYTVNVPAQGGAMLTSASSLNADNMSSGTLPTARLPTGCIVKISANNDNTIVSVTNSDLASMWSHYITRTSTANKILIQASLYWSSTNPNGLWYLERSYDNSTYTRLIRVHQADECKGAGADMEMFSINYLDSPATTSATVYYRVYWRHYTQNGGTMKKNQPVTVTSWDNVETYPITSQIVLSEVVA